MYLPFSISTSKSYLIQKCFDLVYVCIHTYIHVYVVKVIESEYTSGYTCVWDFPSGSVVKNLPDSAKDIGDMSSIPESGRSLGGGCGNPL